MKAIPRDELIALIRMVDGDMMTARDLDVLFDKYADTVEFRHDGAALHAVNAERTKLLENAGTLARTWKPTLVTAVHVADKAEYDALTRRGRDELMRRHVRNELAYGIADHMLADGLIDVREERRNTIYGEPEIEYSATVRVCSEQRKEKIR